MADVLRAQQRIRALESERPSRLLWPWQVRFAEWKRVARAVVRVVSEDRLSLVAAAISFYAVLALFPGLIALVALFGLIAEPVSIESGLAELAGLLPPGARELLRQQLHALASTPRSSLSLGLVVSVATALWSASSGVDSLVEAMNVAYNKIERRSWILRRLMCLLLTLGLIVFTVVAITLVAVLPSLIGWLGERWVVLRIIQIARWPGLAGLVALGLFCLYRYGPCRTRPAKSDISGAIIATVLWLLASSLLSLYVSEFASYHKTYGAFGGLVALLFWFYYSGFVVLLGAELSAELEGEKGAGKTARPEPAQRPAAQGAQAR